MINAPLSAKPTLIRPLFNGPLDIVGDVHGEIEPLGQLLTRLGYDSNSAHPDGRRLVFVGDLGDRGPDSPAVGELVMSLVERGLAQCILGNHELNLLRGDHKAGNAWFMDPTRKEALPGGEFAHSRPATDGFKARYLKFLESLPVALERSDLRVVHAAWVPEEIDELRELSEPTLDVFRRFEALTNSLLQQGAMKELADQEKAEWKDFLHLRHPAIPVPLLTEVGECEERRQMGNPIRVVTSGVERLAVKPFWSSGQWRMVDRVRWWEEYSEDVPVIVGHYWRRLAPIHGSEHASSKPDVFDGIGRMDWMGPKKNVFCVDYSVGARYEERKCGMREYDTHLAAMRWPERELWMETGRVG